MSEASRAGTPVVTLELLEDVDPSMRWRVTAGEIHACGPTIDAALATIERVMAER